MYLFLLLIYLLPSNLENLDGSNFNFSENKYIAIYSDQINCSGCYHQLNDLLDSLKKDNKDSIKILCLLKRSESNLENRRQIKIYKNQFNYNFVCFDKKMVENNVFYNYYEQKYHIDKYPSLILFYNKNILYLSYNDLFENDSPFIEKIRNFFSDH